MSDVQELIKKVKNGDTEAFGLLVKDLLPSAMKTAYLILRSKEYAEDALQNSLEGVYISIIKKDDLLMTNFKAWFYRVVYSRSIDLYRKNKRDLHIHIDSLEEYEYIGSDLTQSKAIQNENKKEMINNILILKKEQSLPLLLYYYENFTIKEISTILNENTNTIKTRMKRGKNKLAKIMKSSTFFEEAQKNEI
ncbi:RNA polymerase sigma factor [Niallia sp. 03133]|uniref:RNA polymerase sigma factor n=1 Tax=Niallia sp. 03133 TaxID=3458060 RepID=UPI0040442B59